MLQNVRVTTFTVSELLRKNQQGEGLKLPVPLSQQIGLFLLPENIFYKFSVDIERGQW